MSLTDNGTNMYMPVAPAGNGYGTNGMWGDGSFWIIVLFLFALMGNGWGGGFGGNGAGAMQFNNTNADVQRGFDHQAVMGGINGIQGGLNSLAQGQCQGFAGVTAAVNSGFAGSEISANQRQMASMQQAWSAQTDIGNRLDTIAMNQQNCCCENRAAIADVKYTIAQEAAATRLANSQNTQAILDKLCQQEIDALKTQVGQLQTQLNMANLAASQGAQTAQLIQDNNAQTNALINRLAQPAPIPAYVVSNPNGCNCGANLYSGLTA